VGNPSETYRSPWFELEGYRACTVKFSNGSKKTVLEHRENLEEKIGRKLRQNEVTHHKNGKKTDNRPENLEPKTRNAHTKLHRLENPAEYTEVTCKWCSQITKKLARQIRHNKKQGKAGPFCNKSCSGKWHRENQIAAGQINLRN
jgi:hypothetical protein